MMIITQLASFLFVVALLIAIIRRYSVQAPKGFKLPPGPKGWPIVGNALQLGRYPQRQLQKWAGQYGGLVKVRLGWENWVFVYSPDAVRTI